MSENLVPPGADLYGKGGRAWLATAPLSPVLRAQTERLLTLHDAATVEIAGLDGDVKRAAKGNPVVKQLTTMPGVGVFSALFVQAEIGWIDRFRTSHELAAYAGLVPTTRSSGGKTAHGGLGKVITSSRPHTGVNVMLMPQHSNLTMRAHEVFALAHDLADRRGDADITPAHLVFGLLQEAQGVAVYVLSARGVALDTLAGELLAELPAPPTPRALPAGRRLAPADDAFVAGAMREARELDTPYYGTEHLLLALLRNPTGQVAQILARHGVGFENARADVRRVLFPSSDTPFAALNSRDDG